MFRGELFEICWGTFGASVRRRVRGREYVFEEFNILAIIHGLPITTPGKRENKYR